jgi:hypothetical membrane protein
VLLLAVLGIGQFVFCTVICMANFPAGYSFSKNFLSDLGRASVNNSSWFNGSMIVLGLTLMPLFGMVTALDPRRSISAKVTTLLGVISALGIVGMGMTPIDRQFFGHHVALAAWLFPMLYMTVSFFYVVSRSPNVGVWFLSASLIMVIGMIAVLFNTRITTIELLQKTVVVCGLIWLIYVIAFICQSGISMIRNWEDSNHLREEKENEYFSTLANQGSRKQSD